MSDETSGTVECEKCHTDHEGWDGRTIGAMIRCERAQSQHRRLVAETTEYLGRSDG